MEDPAEEKTATESAAVDEEAAASVMNPEETTIGQTEAVTEAVVPAAESIDPEPTPVGVTETTKATNLETVIPESDIVKPEEAPAVTTECAEETEPVNLESAKAVELDTAVDVPEPIAVAPTEDVQVLSDEVESVSEPTTCQEDEVQKVPEVIPQVPAEEAVKVQECAGVSDEPAEVADECELAAEEVSAAGEDVKVEEVIEPAQDLPATEIQVDDSVQCTEAAEIVPAEEAVKVQECADVSEEPAGVTVESELAAEKVSAAGEDATVEEVIDPAQDLPAAEIQVEDSVQCTEPAEIVPEAAAQEEVSTSQTECDLKCDEKCVEEQVKCGEGEAPGDITKDIEETPACEECPKPADEAGVATETTVEDATITIEVKDEVTDDVVTADDSVQCAEPAEIASEAVAPEVSTSQTECNLECDKKCTEEEAKCIEGEGPGDIAKAIDEPACEECPKVTDEPGVATETTVEDATVAIEVKDGMTDTEEEVNAECQIAADGGMAAEKVSAPEVAASDEAPCLESEAETPVSEKVVPIVEPEEHPAHV